jgi:hypothetical protein
LHGKPQTVDTAPPPRDLAPVIVAKAKAPSELVGRQLT